MGYDQDLQKAIDFHGHFCPGLAIGYRAAQAARETLGIDRAGDEELVAIVETDACSVDAIQSVLGCTIGKGNLIFKDHGKQAFTIASRKNNKAVRIVIKDNQSHSAPEQDELRRIVFAGSATPAQLQEFEKLQQARIEQLLNMNTTDLFSVQPVNIPLPQPAKIFKSVICEYCGEKTMEPRARIKDGKIACLSCCEEYTRGW